jgi:hypothetical protein
LVVNLNASSYSGSGDWVNSGTGGASYNASPQLNPAYTSYGGGSCFTFTTVSGVSQRFRMSNNPLSTNMTIGVWFKLTGLSNGSRPPGDVYRYWDTSFLIDNELGGSGTNDFGLGITDGHIVWGTTCTGGSCWTASDIEANSNDTYDDGIWHYVAVTRSTSSIYLDIYVDGTKVSTTQKGDSSANPSLALNSTATIGIGGEKSGGRPNYGNKSIATVQMYDRALSNTEILQNYNAMRSNFGR